MKNLFGIGLAFAASASFATANGGPKGEPNGPTKVDPWYQGSQVTFAPGKGITFDGGDGFRLNLQHVIQAQWRYISADAGAPDTNGFRIPRARQIVGGHVWDKNITYRIMFDHADGGTTGTARKDFWVKWKFLEGEMPMSVRLGQGKFRAGRSSDQMGEQLEFVTRSIASRTFATGRSTGALLEGSALEDGMLKWHAGLMNSDTAASSGAFGEENTNTGQNELNFTFGAIFEPMGSMGDDPEMRGQGDLEHSGELKTSFGVNLYLGNERPAGTDVETTSINLNGEVITGTGISGQGEIWIRNDDVDGGGDADSIGWYAQGGYTLAPVEGEVQWGFAGRVSMVDYDDAPVLMGTPGQYVDGPVLLGAATAGDVFEVNLAASAYYHKHALKSQVGVTFQSASPTGGTDTDNVIIEVMMTAAF